MLVVAMNRAGRLGRWPVGSVRVVRVSLLEKRALVHLMKSHLSRFTHELGPMGHRFRFMSLGFRQGLVGHCPVRITPLVLVPDTLVENRALSQPHWTRIGYKPVLKGLSAGPPPCSKWPQGL